MFQPLKFLAPAAVMAALTLSAPAAAGEFTDAMQDYYDTSITSWMGQPEFADAIIAANAVTGAYSQADIDALDLQWRGEIGTSSTPTITPVLEHAVAATLRDVVAQSGGSITEIILMDAQGLNVAVSGITSDMWQGDEAKHQQTYGVGPDALHLSEVELDESTQTYQGQISFPITDPASGAVIGAMTVGVNVNSLM